MNDLLSSCPARHFKLQGLKKAAYLLLEWEMKTQGEEVNCVLSTSKYMLRVAKMHFPASLLDDSGGEPSLFLFKATSLSPAMNMDSLT